MPRLSTQKLSCPDATPSALRSFPLPLVVGVVVQDLITQILFCVALGCALSLVVAVALSPSRVNPAALGILPRLVLAAMPVYLCVDYLLYQDTAIVACSAAAFVFGLYALRGWWVPERLSDAIRLGFRRREALSPGQSALVSVGVVFLTGKQRNEAVAGAALRTRVLTVVRDDRHVGRPDADRSMSSAA
jgi:hypothetical protein